MIDRVAEDELDHIQQRLTRVLSDVREAVEDWQKMHAQAEQIIEDLTGNPPPLPPVPPEKHTASVASRSANATSSRMPLMRIARPSGATVVLPDTFSVTVVRTIGEHVR